MNLKKLFALLLSLLLLGAAAYAQDSLCALPLAEEAWYELSAQDSVLTVRLPIEDENGAWHFLIGNENVLELLTCEVIGDEEGESGDAMWVGSFRSFSSGGETVLQFTLTDKDGAPLQTRLIGVRVTADATITVTEAVEDSFYFVSEDSSALNVALDANPSTGYSWLIGISDEDILTCTAEQYIAAEGSEMLEGASCTWTAQFKSAFNKAGFVTLALSYARPWESVQPLYRHTIRLFVNEAGLIELLPAAVEEVSFRGRYVCEDDGSTVLISARADGTFSAEISIIRLTLQDDGEGIREGNVLTVTATDAAGNPMVWTMTLEGSTLTAVVTHSTWDYLPEGHTIVFDAES